LPLSKVLESFVPGEPLGPPTTSSFVPELSLVVVEPQSISSGLSRLYFHPCFLAVSRIVVSDFLKSLPEFISQREYFSSASFSSLLPFLAIFINSLNARTAS